MQNCCGVYDSNILKWAKQNIGSPDPPQLIVDSEWVVPMRKGNSTVYINETVRKAGEMWDAEVLVLALNVNSWKKRRVGLAPVMCVRNCLKTL